MNNNISIKIYKNVAELLKKFSKNKKKVIEFEPGIYIRVGNNKFKTFQNDGVCCYNCGIEGEYFSLEKDTSMEKTAIKNKCDLSNRYSINLYALDENNTPVLMTHDHVIARGLGGSSNLDNLKTMCSRCNNRKSANETHATRAIQRLLNGNDYYEDNPVLLYKPRYLC